MMMMMMMISYRISKTMLGWHEYVAPVREKSIFRHNTRLPGRIVVSPHLGIIADNASHVRCLPLCCCLLKETKRS